MDEFGSIFAVVIVVQEVRCFKQKEGVTTRQLQERFSLTEVSAPSWKYRGIPDVFDEDRSW